MTHTLTLKEKTALTHDVHRFVFDKPKDLDFTPGQATELSLDQDGWRDQGRPFTFTSQPDDAGVEFVIKSYPDHDGVTQRLARLSPGDSVTMADPFGAIQDKGPGTFIAAGAGLTPFIPILRRRHRDAALAGCRLIYTNKTEADIILRREWQAMADLDTLFTITDGAATTVPKARLDRALLKDEITDFTTHVYICGPEGFVDDIRTALTSLGVPADNIVTEEGF